MTEEFDILKLELKKIELLLKEIKSLFIRIFKFEYIFELSEIANSLALLLLINWNPIPLLL